MADVVSPEKRSQMMSGIRGKNTKPELAVRRGLHALGYRYRLHGKGLPRKPDLVFSKYKAVIFVNGCFWHGHDCHLFKWPSSRTDFWENKINKNKKSDSEGIQKLADLGWRICTIWECALKGKTKKDFVTVMEACHNWLESSEPLLEIRGI